MLEKRVKDLSKAVTESIKNIHEDIETMVETKHKRNAKSITERNRSDIVDKPVDPVLKEKEDYLKKLS